MTRYTLIAFLSFWTACSTSAAAQEAAERKIGEAALREAREIMALELFGHYDIGILALLAIDDLRSRVSLGRDYGLASVTLTFSARRNGTKHPSLNPVMFEPGSAMCQDWLYLHCGVPVGHVFEGKIQLLLAVDGDGTWRAVSPHWRSRRQYALDGYLLLEGREPGGYVAFPKPPGR